MTRKEPPPIDQPTPWCTVRQAARRAQCSTLVIYRAIRAGKLKAARLTAGNEFRIHVDWIDAWFAASATVVNPSAPGPSAVLTHRGRSTPTT